MENTVYGLLNVCVVWHVSQNIPPWSEEAVLYVATSSLCYGFLRIKAVKKWDNENPKRYIKLVYYITVLQTNPQSILNMKNT